MDKQVLNELCEQTFKYFNTKNIQYLSCAYVIDMVNYIFDNIGLDHPPDSLINSLIKNVPQKKSGRFNYEEFKSLIFKEFIRCETPLLKRNLSLY